MATYTLPDLLGRLRDHYIGHADVAALVDGRVYVLRMPTSPTFPLVLLTSVVTAPMVDQTDKLATFDVQVECYGANAHDEHAAWTLASTCHAVLHDLSGNVTGATTLTGLQPIPDRELDKARWMFDARLFGYMPAQP